MVIIILLLLLSVQANDFSLAPLHVKAVVTTEKYCQLMVNFTVRPYDNMNITWKLDEENYFQFCSNTSICTIRCDWYFSYIFHVQISKTGFPIYHGNWTFKVNKTIYKLSRLTQVTVFANNENISLSYAIMNKYDKIFMTTCIYRIFYKSEWDKTAKNFTTNKTDVVLENLVPYTTYTIDIQARINESMYWSDKLTREKKTLPSAPYAGPESTNGSYLETPCKEENKRCFILYWAMIPKPLRNGILDTFIIQQNGTIMSETSKIFAQINDQPQNKDLWFGIRAKTNDSQYSPPTIIHIPPKAPERPRAVTVVKLNGTHFSISWTLKQSWENKTVTVMSCFGEKAGSTLWCKSDVMWIKIRNKNSTILKAPKATNFAASVSNSEGSSSLTLAKCLLGGGKAKTPPKPVIFKRSPYKMNLQWPLFDCNELNGRPTLFQVLYAEGNSCRNGLELNIPAIGIKPETEITEIKNLKPFTRYSVCFRIRTEEGWSQIGPHVIATTDETNPGSVRNLQVTNITSYSVTLKWDPTLQPNGIITKYIVTYLKLGDSTYKIFSSSSNMANVSRLNPYSEYNFTVSTCNKVGCSMVPRYASAKTLIRNTAVVDLQLTLNKSILIINWKPPSLMGEHVLYYNIKIIYNTKEDIKNVTNTKYILSFSCESDLIFKTVNVTAVIKNGSSMIYGEPRTESPNLCPKSDEIWIIILLLTLIAVGIFIVIYCIKWISKNAKKTNISANFPEVIRSNSVTSSTSDFDLQTSFIDKNTMEFITTKEEQSLITDNNSEEMDFLSTNICQKEDHCQRNLPQVIFNQTNLDVINNVSTSELNQDNSDSIVLLELNSANLDSNGYACNEMKSPELSQVSSNCNNYIQNNINSSELSQPNSDSIILSELNSTNLDSNGYASNEMMSPELSHVSSNSDNYARNNINSSELSQTNSDSIALSKLNSENLDSNGYASNEMKSPELSQVNSDSENYVQNNINSSELSQTSSDSNNYRDTPSFKLKSVKQDSNDCKYKMNSSELNQANSNRDVQNNTNPSKLSQTISVSSN